MKKKLSCYAAAALFLILTAGSDVYGQAVYIAHYVFPDFVKGTVRLKTGVKEQALLNYNLLTQEMLFQSNGTVLALAQPENIDTIYMNGRKFIPWNQSYLEVAGTGAVPLFIRHKGTVIPPGKPAGYGATSQASNISNVSGFSIDMAYRLKLPDDYKVLSQTAFLLKKGDDYVVVTSSKQVLQAFPGKSAAIKEYIKNNHPDFKDPEDLKKLILFCNTAS